MHVAFISDLHLTSADEATDRRFRKFTRGAARRLDHLYVLGDLFDYWLGDAQLDWDVYARSVVDEFASLARSGTRLHLMRGNRDFLLGHRFARAAGARLMPEREVLRLEDADVLVMHGDELCTDDIRYQRVRPMLRSRAFAMIANRLPRGYRQSLAERLRAKSIAHKSITAMSVMDANPLAIRRALERAGVRTLVHGHTHRPGRFDVPSAGTRHVLTDWQQPAPLLGWKSGRGFYPLDDGGL